MFNKLMVACCLLVVTLPIYSLTGCAAMDLPEGIYGPTGSGYYHRLDDKKLVCTSREVRTSDGSKVTKTFCNYK